jgi:hypothetical protein
MSLVVRALMRSLFTALCGQFVKAPANTRTVSLKEFTAMDQSIVRYRGQSLDGHTGSWQQHSNKG